MAAPRTLSNLPLDKINTQDYQYINIAIFGNTTCYNVWNNVYYDIKSALLGHYSFCSKISSFVQLYEFNKETTKLFTSTNENTPVHFYFFESQVITTLPENMNANLVTFFKNYKPEYNNNYCCINFAYEIAYGRGVIKNDNEITVDINRIKDTIYEENLSPGKIVVMFKQNNMDFSNVHYAIYLGQQYYLYLSGTQDGKLLVSSLEAMKKGYQAETCIVFEEKMENKNLKFLEKSPGLTLFSKLKEPKEDEPVPSVAPSQQMGYQH